MRTIASHALHFMKRHRPMFRVKPFGLCPTEIAYSIIRMLAVQWAFPESTVKGVNRFYDGSTCIVQGYRCEVCNRVFFAATWELYQHECMEPDAERKEEL